MGIDPSKEVLVDMGRSDERLKEDPFDIPAPI